MLNREKNNCQKATWTEGKMTIRLNDRRLSDGKLIARKLNDWRLSVCKIKWQKAKWYASNQYWPDLNKQTKTT